MLLRVGLFKSIIIKTAVDERGVTRYIFWYIYIFSLLEYVRNSDSHLRLFVTSLRIVIVYVDLNLNG